MKLTYLLCCILLISSLPLMAKKKNSEWQTIPIASQLDIIDDEGMPRSIYPACAFDTVPSPIDGAPLDNAFRFYFKKGHSKNVLVYFNGGGSCWNDATCVASLALAAVPGDRPTYNPSILVENSPVDAGGIFDDGNKNNPFRNWSKIYIPYCTGDIHVGTNEVDYTDVDGSITGIVGAPVKIKHRGFDNFMAVREWMKTNLNVGKKKIKKLLVTGSSAGGYGATLNFPFIQSAFPEVNAAMLADASASVLTEGFVSDVFAPGSTWNVEQSLPPLFGNDVGVFTAQGLNVNLFQKLSETYPDSRFAQYSTVQDFVQVLFLKVMDQLDMSNTNPFSWALEPADYVYFGEWNARMTTSFDYLSNNTDNYQYYIGAGSVHTILTDAFATPEIPHPFYNENSAQGVKFSEWLDRFSNAKKFKDKSVKFEQ